MTVLTETIHVGEFLLSEDNSTRCRENVTVTVSGATTWLSGTVLGKITASGKFRRGQAMKRPILSIFKKAEDHELLGG